MDKVMFHLLSSKV